MASQTTTLHLKKPALTDDALIGDINDNMDLIDTYATNNNQAITTLNGIIADAVSVTDCDNATDQNKVYYCNNTAAHSPGAYYYFIRPLYKSGNNITQIATGMTSTVPGIYIRSCVNGTWNSWQEFAQKKTPQSANLESGITGAVSYATAGNIATVSGWLSVSSASAGDTLATGLPAPYITTANAAIIALNNNAANSFKYLRLSDTGNITAGEALSNVNLRFMFSYVI